MKCKLCDICTYRKEKVSVSNLTLRTYISTENMLPNKRGVSKASSLPTIELTQKYMKGDVLVSNIRPYFKKVWQAKYDGGCSNDVLVFRANSNIDKDFLYYILSNDTFFTYSMATSKGTKMPRGDKTSIMQYEVQFFDIETQKRIGSILKLLDAKLEINDEINNNLEQQARAIFENWFVSYEPFEFKKPESWKTVTLGSVCKCELGGTPSRNKPEFWNGTIPWINSGEINNFRITTPSELITELGLSKSATKLLPAKTTVLAITGATLGQVSLLEIDSCTNQSVVGVIPNEKLPYEFIYPFIKYNIDELISHQTGGAQQHINKQNVESLSITIPSDEVIEKYVSMVSCIYASIANNCFENERLISIRDTLLPKLMSGELDVSNIDL